MQNFKCSAPSIVQKEVGWEIVFQIFELEFAIS